LSTEFWEEFNVFYHHYTREDQSKAENNYRKWAKSRGQGENCYPPPLVPFSQSEFDNSWTMDK
jgi:E3 ubiquitin-protein ligase UBR2